MANATPRHRVASALLPAALLAAALGGCGSDPEPRPRPDAGPDASAPPTSAPTGYDASPLLEAMPEATVLDGRPVVLTGAPGGAYYEAARGLSRLGEQVRAPLALLPTQGSVDALYGVALGLGDLGIVQGDVLRDPAHAAVRQGVEVLWPLMRERVHVVVRSDGPQTLWDLSGKRIAIGPPGGGAATTAHNLLAALRQVQADLAAQEEYVSFDAPTFERRATAAALRDLHDGALDAVVVVGADPVPALLRAEGFALLSLGEPLVAALQAIEPLYAAEEIDPAAEGYYPGLSGPTRTVSVPAVLVARAGLTEWAPLQRLSAHVRDAAGAFYAVHPAAVARGSLPGGPLAGPADPRLATREGVAVRYRDPALPLRVAAGAPGGTYARVAEGIERALGGAVIVEPVHTTGALQNLALVASGQAELAIVQEDLLLEALRRAGTARLVARTPVVAPLFAEEVHLVGAAAQDGLAGLRLGLGEAGSGTLLTATRLLRSLGVERHQVSGLAAGRATTLAALTAGDLDAAFFVGGQPLEFLGGLEQAFAPVSEQPGYRPATLDPQAYPVLIDTTQRRQHAHRQLRTGHFHTEHTDR